MTVTQLLNLRYLERHISVGEVVNDGQGLLKPRASNSSICDQLAHCFDNLKWRQRLSVALEDPLYFHYCKSRGAGGVSLTCKCERTIDLPFVNSKFCLMKK